MYFTETFKIYIHNTYIHIYDITNISIFQYVYCILFSRTWLIDLVSICVTKKELSWESEDVGFSTFSSLLISQFSCSSFR